MNRYRREELRKHREARAGLSELEIKRLDSEDALEHEITDLARSIHGKRFPEEYDHMYDSIADANDRASRKNPMNAEYITKVAARRAGAGVAALSESGMPVNDDTWKIAYAEAEVHIRGRNT